jgi:hypothetical protein
LVEDIRAIAELETREDAIMMGQDESDCLDNLSLEGDNPDDVSDSGENREKALFPRVKFSIEIAIIDFVGISRS